LFFFSIDNPKERYVTRKTCHARSATWRTLVSIGWRKTGALRRAGFGNWAIPSARINICPSRRLYVQVDG